MLQFRYLIVILLIFYIPSFGQLKSYGFKFGIDNGNFSGTGFKEQKYYTGLITGIYADFTVSPKVILQPEVLFVRHGTTAKNYSISLSYFEIPFLVKTNILSLELYTGLSYGMLLSSQYQYPAYNNEYLYSKANSKIEFKDQIVQLKLGARYNINVSSRYFSIEARYNFGILEISDGVFNNSLSVMIGFNSLNEVRPGNKTKLDSIKQLVIRDIKYLMRSDEISYLISLNTEEEVEEYVDDFWKDRDTNPTTKVNEYKEIYYKRIEEADRLFIEAQNAGSQTDRGRIFILDGPPDEVHRENMIQDHNNLGIQAMELWVYDVPSGNVLNNNIFSDVFPGRKRFVFADLHGYGVFEQIFSSEKKEKTDPRTYLEYSR